MSGTRELAPPAVSAGDLDDALRIAAGAATIPIHGAAVLHLTWALLIFATPHALGATATAALYQRIPSRWGLAIVLVLVASAAWLATRLEPGWRTLCLLVPQQTALLDSARGALWAVAHGQYADKAVYPWGFIGADQAIYVILAGMHFLALGLLHGFGRWWLRA